MWKDGQKMSPMHVTLKADAKWNKYITCVASFSVGMKSKERPRNGIMVFPAYKALKNLGETLFSE